MNININTNRPHNNDTLLIPIAQSSKLSKELSIIAKEFNLPFELLSNDFTANQKSFFCFYPSNHAKKVFLIGCGNTVNYKTLSETFKTFSYQEKEKLGNTFTLDFSFFPDEEIYIESAINGLMLGGYSVGLFKSKTENKHTFKKKNTPINIVTPIAFDTAKNAAKKGYETALTQMSIMDLVNAPGNKTTPTSLGNWAIDSAKKYGYNTRVLDKAQIKENNLHTLLAVNKGSEYPPTFIIMEYIPEGIKNAPKIGLVGKGVTFDTGGLSVKPSNNMHYMKSDMGGAAAVLGTMELTAKLKLPVHLIAVVPATDNCVDANAIRPGDIINSHSGRTIEVIDTDAEGRLILADGISYINKNYAPDIILDLATLTGSCVRTFGYHAAGLFTKNNTLIQQLIDAGEQTGEQLWPLPMWDIYGDDLRSDVADIKNYSSIPMSGAIVAAKFIEFFTQQHPNWAHLDIAGTAFGDSGLSREKSATAFGVNLLIAFIEKQCELAAETTLKIVKENSTV